MARELDDSFTRQHVLKTGPRRVRTPAGAKYFGRPIGSIITPWMVRHMQDMKRDRDVIYLHPDEVDAIAQYAGSQTSTGPLRTNAALPTK